MRTQSPTVEEYQVKAMLLDMVFNGVAHAFVPKPKNAPHGDIYGATGIWFDADTLEPLNHETRKERRLQAKITGKTLGGFMCDTWGTRLISDDHIDNATVLDKLQENYQSVTTKGNDHV